MARGDRRFARFYYDDFQHDYADVYVDDAALATWMRLLVIAEVAWPTPPELPRSVRSGPLRVLVSAGLIDLGPRYTFSVRGHDAERARRHAIAVGAAYAKGAPSAVPNGAPNGAPNVRPNADPRREQDENKTSTPPPQVGKRGNGTNPRALGTNPRANGTSPRQERQAAKRAPTKLHDILTAIQKGES